MDKETLLKSLAGTLDSNQQVRKQSEQQLHVFEEQPGFTAYLLDLIAGEEVQLGIKVSAAILFKNRVINYWVDPENKAPSPITIRDNEKPAIKEKLIQTLIKTYKNNQLKLQLATALHNILACEKWSELVPIIKNLLNDTSNIDHVYTALICLYEYTKNYRWSSHEASTSSPVLEEVAIEIYPSLEVLASELLQNDSPVSDELLLLIIKIFKFTTFSSLPSYLQDASKLGNWLQLHILIINKPLPQSVLNEDIEGRTQQPRIKTVKWCFGNLHRFLGRHGGGFATKDKKNNQFAASFLSHFVPEILNAYWKIIEDWSTKKIWLSEGSLYHLISFLEQLIDTPGWALIGDKLDAIIKHVILPTLNATDETIELYEDDSEEYIRRFFDINRESSSSDVASINFIYKLATKKFKSTSNQLLSIINDVFTRRAANRNDISAAKEIEGAFRVLSTISDKLDKPSSPVNGQVDRILHSFVYPELSAQSVASTPWLTARACDTLAMFRYQYQDPQVLQDIFQGIIACYQNESQFPIQLTAVDALCTLVEEDLVAEHIAEQAPQLMGSLLEMSKKFESDILTAAMETFVSKFAKNLEPYATELATKLMEQFLRSASEILEQSGGEINNIDVDKEYQAAGVLNTLTSLVIAMTSSPDVAASLEFVLQDMIKFILDNAMVSFLTEAIEILESILFSTRTVSPTMWGLFETCISAFDTYAYEYCDSFQPFFESIINQGFSKPEITVDNPHVQSILTVCMNVLKSDPLEPIFADGAFELLELIVLALNDRFVPLVPAFLPEIYGIFSNLESENCFDGYMLSHLSILKVIFGILYVDPVSTIQFLREKSFIPSFFKLWMNNSQDFQSVYGCKLQILASLALVKSDAITLIPEDLVSEAVDLLISNVSALPGAIRTKEEILSKEKSFKDSTAIPNGNGDEEEDEYEDAYYDDDLEADEAELEAMKETPIDSLNVFQILSNEVVHLQQVDPAKHQALFGGLEQEQKEMLEQLIKITREQQQK